MSFNGNVYGFNGDKVGPMIYGWGQSRIPLPKYLANAGCTFAINVDRQVKALANPNLIFQSVLENLTKKVDSIRPLHVECFSDFCNAGLGVPSGIANYTGGNFFLGVNGNQGDSFVTVTSGNISHAGSTTKWAAVLKDDNGRWTPIRVLGTDGASIVNLDRPLKSNITNGELANLHDANLGQHYTERGYYALAQHLYHAKTKKAERNVFLKKFKTNDSSGEWVKIGNPFVTYNNALNSYSSGNLKNPTTPHLSLYVYGNGTTQGMEWEINVTNKNGFFEMFVSENLGVGALTVEILLDGAISKTLTEVGKTTIERVILPFSNATKAKVRVFIQNSAVVNGIRIGQSTWWLNERHQSESNLINANSKVVYIGDSWGTYHNKAITRELSSLIGSEVINVAQAGHTSKWANEWFDNLVVSENPEYVIIEFFVNDYNSANGTNVGTYIGTDDQVKDMNVTYADWNANIKEMCAKAVQNGIQPIIVGICSTNSESQSQGLFNNSDKMLSGGSFSEIYNNVFLQSFAGTTADGYIKVTLPNSKTPYFLKFDGTDSYGIMANTADTEVIGTGNFGMPKTFVTAPTLTDSWIDSKAELSEATAQFGLKLKTNGNLEFWLNGSAITVATGLAINTLYNVIIVRESGVLKCEVNGVETYSQANTTNITTKPNMRIGAISSNAGGTTHTGFTNVFYGAQALFQGTLCTMASVKKAYAKLIGGSYV